MWFVFITFVETFEMDNSAKKIEDFTNKIIKFIEALDEEEQLMFVSNVVVAMIACGNFSHIERLGILECARLDIINNLINPETDEEVKRITNSN